MPEREPTEKERMRQKLEDIEMSLNDLAKQIAKATPEQAINHLIPNQNNLLIKREALKQRLSTSTAGHDVMNWNIQMLN